MTPERFTITLLSGKQLEKRSPSSRRRGTFLLIIQKQSESVAVVSAQPEISIFFGLSRASGSYTVPMLLTAVK